MYCTIVVSVGARACYSPRPQHPSPVKGCGDNDYTYFYYTPLMPANVNGYKSPRLLYSLRTNICCYLLNTIYLSCTVRIGFTPSPNRDSHY